LKWIKALSHERIKRIARKWKKPKQEEENGKKRIHDLCRFGENEDESLDLHANFGRCTLSSSEIREDVSPDKQC